MGLSLEWLAERLLAACHCQGLPTLHLIYDVLASRPSWWRTAGRGRGSARQMQLNQKLHFRFGNCANFRNERGNPKRAEQ